MSAKKSFDTGMTMFYEFSVGEKFVGRFTGKYKEVGENSHPLFVDEDGVEWLLNNHSMIKKICDELPVNTLVEITYKGIVNIKKTGRKFANYSVSYFSDETKKEETQNPESDKTTDDTQKEKDHHNPPEKSDEEKGREASVRKSKGSRLSAENRE